MTAAIPGGMHMKTLLRALCLLLCPGFVGAQEPAAVRKIVLPNLDSQVRARLVALDARLNPVHTPHLAASLIGNLTTPWTAFAPILADARNNDVWEQLAEEYYRMMLESGDALVTIQETAPPGSAWTSAQVRRLCHQRLASLPRASVELYRQSVNAEAKALLEQGRQKRSPVPLRRLADELFCSRSGDKALDLLGDLAFERGHFDEARHWWSLLAPVGAHLHFPDPQVDVVRVQAKQLLALIFQGRLDDAGSEIARFRQKHPHAQGDLAAEQGLYHKILDKTLATCKREHVGNNDEPWTTFGGDPSRNRTLSQTLSYHLLEDGPAWRVKLPSLVAPGKDPGRASLARGIAFHPIIVHEQIVIADHRSVVSYHLKTGKEAFRYDLKAAGLQDPGPLIDGAIRLPRFTLSADHERAYVRLGALKIGPRKEGEKEEASYLVCLDLTEPGRDKPRELWHVQASADTLFEGSPLVHDGGVHIALSKIVDRHALVAIRCYDVLGRLRWSREVCDAPEFAEGSNGPRYRQHLLTLAGGQIVYATHAGAIVAVDAWTGQPTWAVRYPSRGPLTPDLGPSPRDLTPCVYADGFVYAAPLDADRLLCIDAISGQVRWEVEGVEVVHLLGVSHNRVFVATRAGLQTYRTSSGRSEWMQPSDGRLPSLGRGLIAGSSLFWPTQDAQLPCRVFTLREGTQVVDPARLWALPAGNWGFGHGCLAVAGQSELVVYVPPRHVPKLPIDPRPQAMNNREDNSRLAFSARKAPPER